jgi:hypothetical protein
LPAKFSPIDKSRRRSFAGGLAGGAILIFRRFSGR